MGRESGRWKIRIVTEEEVLEPLANSLCDKWNKLLIATKTERKWQKL